MAKFELIYDRPGETPMYLGTDDDVGGTDVEINAALPEVPVGTVITTAGFGTMKQLGSGGHWATLETGGSGPNVIDGSTATAFTGLLKGNGSTVAQAVAGTDYQAPLVAGTDYQAPISAANKLSVANVSGYTTTQMVVTYDDDSTATFNVMVVSAS